MFPVHCNECWPSWMCNSPSLPNPFVYVYPPGSVVAPQLGQALQLVQTLLLDTFVGVLFIAVHVARLKSTTLLLLLLQQRGSCQRACCFHSNVVGNRTLLPICLRLEIYTLTANACLVIGFELAMVAHVPVW